MILMELKKELANFFFPLALSKIQSLAPNIFTYFEMRIAYKILQKINGINTKHPIPSNKPSKIELWKANKYCFYNIC